MCIFCKIRDGEINSKKYYEDDNSFIIADIAPKAKKHYLFITKNHYKLIKEQTEKDTKILGLFMLKFLPYLTKFLILYHTCK